ncbi:MAG: dihydroorotate dehydrogenase electron transfer subunit [Thermoguttaceae bacterium]|nr:dihydroorotate dehydrogenase electron transfer subunit [Thermoguttaceae bacterium]MDW8036626.1 dihydroorotate dehydrogenase electron transfer subunit [Thermoguttaceae bacterium]
MGTERICTNVSDYLNTPDPTEQPGEHCPKLAASGRVWHGTVEILSNKPLAERTYRISFLCPSVAGRIVPGQFVMVRLPGWWEPLFGRAMALYDVLRDEAGQAIGLQLVYRVVGRVTGRLAQLRPGDQLELWGPLGNGFAAEPVEHLVMVAGGIGFTPFLALAQEALGRCRYGSLERPAGWAQKVSLCYGEPTAALLAPVEEFQQAGIELHLATEDGSRGHKGLVTELIEPIVAQSKLSCRIVCCGPEPMMAATAQIARRLGLPCLASLERPMACGLGICFSCVVRVREPNGNWDYRRACVDGPVFDAHQILWEREQPPDG